MSETIRKQVAIVGSGPAGLTAAIYTARADLDTVVIEGMQPGGQLTITTDVENYPGFPEGIMGPELMGKMREQAEKYEAQILRGNVTSVDFSSDPLRLTTDEAVIEADAVIIATGASARLLNIPSEKRLFGKGVSACATCDGFFYRGKEIVVIGGGDSAIEEAHFLTKFASKVHIVHRRNQLRASKAMVHKAETNEKVAFIWDSVVDEILGDTMVTGIRLKNVKTGDLTEMPIDGVFLGIGHTPNTDAFKGQIDFTDEGYVKVTDSVKTSVEGVFSAGDVMDHVFQQAVTAAGAGCKAALACEKYLEDKTAGV